MNQTIEQRVGLIERRLQRVEERLDLSPLVEVEPGDDADVLVEISPDEAPHVEAPPREAPRVEAPTFQAPSAPVIPIVPIAPIATPGRATPPPLPMRPFTPSPSTLGEGRGEGAFPPPHKTLPAHLGASPHPSPLPDYRERGQEPPIPPTVLPYVSPKPIKPAKQSGLEQTIGLKWAGWIGAVVLLIGAALGVKYAYDQHWFAQLPIWIWPSIIAACGFALIGAGEWVYRKVNVIPAASFFGAGVATLFLVSYIGHSYYALYPPTTAFVLMGITTLIGSAVAMRGRLVSIAVLSLIGGNVAPLVMGDTGAPHSTFMAYLLMLQLIALTLAWWGRSARWWMLRGVSLATTALWTSAIIAGGHDGMMPLGFAIVYAILYHAETILSAVRADRDPEKSRDLQHGGTIFVTLVIAGLTAAILTVLDGSAPMTRAGWLVGEAIIYGIAAFTLRDPARRLTRSLAPAYTACAAALIILAVPVAFDGMSVEIGWAVLAIAMAILGRTLRSRMSQAGAVVAWVLALLHLISTLPAVDYFHEHPVTHIWLTIAGVGIASTTILAWGLALVGHVISGLMYRDDSDSKSASAAMGFAATVVFVAASIASLPALGATLSLIVFAWLMLGADLPFPKLRLVMHSMAVLLIATVKWVAVDTLGQRLSPDWSAAHYLPVVNPLMGIGALLAVSIAAIYWLRRDAIRTATAGNEASSFGAGVALIVTALLAIGLSFEIDRVVERALLNGTALAWPAWQMKQMAWTMLWSLMAGVLALAISRMTSVGEKRDGWITAIEAFVMLMVGKFIVLDTLLYRLFDGSASAGAIFNLQTITAATVVATLAGVRTIARSAKPQADKGKSLYLVALFVIAWTGTFEIDRWVGLHPALVAPWPMHQFRQMGWTIWWTMCAASGFVLGRKFDRDVNPASAWARVLPKLMQVLVVKFMIVDALFWRISEGVTLAPVIANVQALTAAILMAAMVLLIAMGLPGEREFSQRMRVRVGFLTWILALLAVSLEIDRFFEGPRAAGVLADPRLAKQVAFSIVWSIFAVLSVAAGFRMRLASLRYFGLTLLALTLLKVVTVDLGQVSTGYRILSFLGLGLLMLGTSVLYGKLSPRLLKEPEVTGST